jgi:hypothetical protein
LPEESGSLKTTTGANELETNSAAIQRRLKLVFTSYIVLLQWRVEEWGVLKGRKRQFPMDRTSRLICYRITPATNQTLHLSSTWEINWQLVF